MSYVKLHQELFESTIWQESAIVRLAWITILLMANKEGEVMASIPGLANRVGCSVSEAEEAINKFLGPDKYSRTQDDEGRRLEVIEGGWAVLNHEKYRNKGSITDGKEQNRIRQQRFRDKQKRNAKSVTNNTHITDSPYIAEAEAYTEADTKKKPKERGAKRSAKAAPLSDDDFFLELEKEEAYSHIAIKIELAKMAQWCSVNKKQATRRRFISWINRIDRPMDGPGAAKKEFNNAW